MTGRARWPRSAAYASRCARATGEPPRDRRGGQPGAARPGARGERRGARIGRDPGPDRRHDRDHARRRRRGAGGESGGGDRAGRRGRGAAGQPALPLQAAGAADRDRQSRDRAARRRRGAGERGLPVGAEPARGGAAQYGDPGPLSRPGRSGARGGEARPDGRDVPARAGPPRRRAVPGPGEGPGHPGHLGSIQPLPPGGLRGARPGDRGANRVMTAYWCELAWLGGERAEAGVLIDVDGGRITGVTAGVPAPLSDAVRLDGLTLPGLANAHSHAFQRALRGRTQHGTGSFWTWREQMYRAAERIEPDTYLALARATYAEMALAGITAVGEFHYLYHGPGGTPYDDPNEMGRALLAAAAEAGIRISLIDACYLHGGIGEPPEG